MHKPLLSVYFVVRAEVEQPNGERRLCEELIHKVCKREEIEQPSYLDYVAWGLYVQFKYTANRVIALTVLKAEGPGCEQFHLNHTALPGDIDPDWRAA